MLDHIGFPVLDFPRSKAFYITVLAPLGYELLKDIDLSDETGPGGYAGFGNNGRAQFWIGTGAALQGRLHVAFSAPTHKCVDGFYAAALASGAKDNGAPGFRPHYHENYYAAFVLDPDGHNIEAVCQLPGAVADQFRRRG